MTFLKINSMRKTIVLVFSLFVFLSINAQSSSTNSYSYKTALGVKVWDGAGISLKHFFNSKDAGELVAFFYGHGFRLTGLYEIHGPFSGAPGLKWYIGPGVHVAFYDLDHHHHDHGDHHHANAGIDGVIGLDYKFRGAPINISLDWQPSFEFGHHHGFTGSWGGLGIRYTF
jgi:hypothetical protein